MSKRPFVSFAEVKEKVSIPDALEALGISDALRRTGSGFTGVCPLPAHRHGPSPNPDQFKVNQKDGAWLWHCFGDCKRGGDVIELVKSVTGYDDAHVRFWFAEKFGDRLSARKSAGNQQLGKDTAHDDSQKDPPQAAPSTPSNLSETLPPLKPLRFRLDLDTDAPYLRQRGLNEETIRRFGLGLCRRGLLKGYVAIPVYAWPHEDGQNPVAYLGRWPGDTPPEHQPRYKWPEGFLKSRVVYGLQQALETPSSEPLIVVEGPFAVYHLAQAGLRSAVAIFGSSLSEEQTALLIRTGRAVALLLDGDEAGRQGLQAAISSLISKTLVRALCLAEGQQPDRLSPIELQDILR